jgi:hypothetical protein
VLTALPEPMLPLVMLLLLCLLLWLRVLLPRGGQRRAMAWHHSHRPATGFSPCTTAQLFRPPELRPPELLLHGFAVRSTLEIATPNNQTWSSA